MEAPAAPVSEPPTVPPAGSDAGVSTPGVPGGVTCQEAMGVRAVTARWAQRRSGVINELGVTLRNNTDAPVMVRPEVSGATPHAPPARRALDGLELGPREERTVYLPVAGLPVQTEGTATAIEVGVKWSRPHQSEMVASASVTGSVFVTHVAGKTDEAMVLTPAEQLVAQRREDVRKRPTQLRRFDERSGSLLTAAATELADMSEVSIGLTPEVTQ